MILCDNALNHQSGNGPSKRTHDDMPPMDEEVPIGCLVQTISWVESHICSPQSLCPTALQCELPKPEKQGTGCSLRLSAISILGLGVGGTKTLHTKSSKVQTRSNSSLNNISTRKRRNLDNSQLVPSLLLENGHVLIIRKIEVQKNLVVCTHYYSILIKHRERIPLADLRGSSELGGILPKQNCSARPYIYLKFLCNNALKNSQQKDWRSDSSPIDRKD